MSCVIEKDAYPHFAFFFPNKFSFCHSHITRMDIFIKVFSETTYFRIMKSLTFFFFSLQVLQPPMATTDGM